MVRKVCVYARCSTSYQQVSNQLIEIRDHCSKMGWEIVKEYVDEGLSGTLSRDNGAGSTQDSARSPAIADASAADTS